MQKKHWIIIGIVVFFGWYFLFIHSGAPDVYTDINAIFNKEGAMLVDMDDVHNVSRSGKYMFTDYVSVSGTYAPIGQNNVPLQTFPFDMSLTYSYSLFDGWELVSVNSVK